MSWRSAAVVLLVLRDAAWCMAPSPMTMRRTLTSEQEASLARIVREEKRVETARVELASSLGRSPTPREWARAVNSDVESLRSLRSSAIRAKNVLVEANAGLVRSVARRYRGTNAHDDLVQEGTLGLIHAIEKYDPSKGRLSTYATLWIRASMSDYLRRKAPVVVPQRAIDLDRRKTREIDALFEELGRPPTPDELEVSMNLTKAKIDTSSRVAKLASPSLSLEQTSDATGFSLGDTLRAPDDDDDLRNVLGEHAMLREALFRALTTHLDDRQLRVVRLRYGLDDGIQRSTRDTAQLLGLSKETVRMTCLNAFRKLRGTALGEALLEFMD